MRHPGQVYGHSKGRFPGQKQYYRKVYSGSKWGEFLIANRIGRLLEVCCGGSFEGDVRLDRDPEVPSVTVVADQLRLPFRNGAFDTVACDPMYDIQNPDRVRLQRELVRVSRRRVLFKAPWVPRARGWKLQEPVTGILSHTCGNVAILAVLDRLPVERDLFSPERSER